MFYSYGYIFYIPINIIYAAIVVFYGTRKKSAYPYYIFATIMALYMNAAINLAYFPIVTVPSKEWGSLISYIDVSFNFAEMGGMYQILGNMLLTVPLGVIIPFISSSTKWKNRIGVMAISCAVELAQILIIYFTHSVTIFFDIKDLILNVLGGIIGCVLFEILAKIISRVVHSDSKSDFWNYIYEKCR